MQRLFDEFDPASSDQWAGRISEELGKSVDDLTRVIGDGILVPPFYHPDKFLEKIQTDQLPGKNPFLRGPRASGSFWKIYEEVPVVNADETDRLAQQAIHHGAGGIVYEFPENWNDFPDINLTFKPDPFPVADIILRDSLHPRVCWTKLRQALSNVKENPENITGGLAYDPLGFLLKHGDFPTAMNDTFSWGKEIIMESRETFPAFRTLSVSGYLYREAGATIAHELAFSLAQGKEFLDIFTNLGIPGKVLLDTLSFELASGPDFFSEIAKLRTFRVLWNAIASKYIPSNDEPPPAHINVRTAFWNMTEFDPHVNMLRATTESMSAIIGGVDSLSVKGFDEVYGNASSFARRIALNTQLILRYEAYFDKVADPAAGSYYVEHLSEELGRKAWNLFLEMEKKGGFLKASEDGFIQQLTENERKKKISDLRQGSQVLIGTTSYPLRDEPLPDAALKVPDKSGEIPGKLRVKPLIPERMAVPFETLRKKVLESGKIPSVFILGFGKPADRIPRETFAANFMGLAGFKILDGFHFKDLSEGVEKIKELAPQIVVICSHEKHIEDVATRISTQLPEEMVKVLAGSPGEKEQDFREKGIKFFIHRKSDRFEVLQEIIKILGID